MIRQNSLLIRLRSSLKKLKIVIDCDKTSMVSAHCCHHFKHFFLFRDAGEKLFFKIINLNLSCLRKNIYNGVKII